MRIILDKDKCIGCGACIDDCTRDVIKLKDGKAYVTAKPCLQCFHCFAVCPTGAYSIEDFDGMEGEKVIERKDNDFENFEEAVYSSLKMRRSVRRFKEGKVSKEEIEKILDVGRHAPTGCNRQPMKFIVLDKDIEKIKLEAMASLKDLVICNPTSPCIANDTLRIRFKNMLEEYKTTGIDRLFFNAPQVIIVACDYALGGQPELDGGITAAYMEIQAESMGIGVCYLGMLVSAVENNPEIAKMLGLSETEKIVTAFTIGYPRHRYFRTVYRNPLKAVWL